MSETIQALKVKMKPIKKTQMEGNLGKYLGSQRGTSETTLTNRL